MPLSRAREGQASRAKRNLPWGPMDQILSSVTNSLIVVLAARRLSSGDLGGFAVAMSAAMICIGLARTLTSQPVTILYSGTGSADLRRAIRRAVAHGAVLALAAGVVVSVLGVVVAGGSLGGGLVVVGAGLVMLLTQDTLRFAFFALGRPWGAAISDLVWLLVVAGALFWNASTPASLLTWWVAGAGVAAAVSVVHIRLWVGASARSFSATGWFKEHRSLTSGLLADSVLVTLAGQSMPILLGLVASLEASGHYRVAQTAIGPMATVMTGSAIQLLPALVRENSPAGRRGASRSFSVRFASMSLGYTALILVAPTNVVDTLFGDSWASARATAVVLGLSTAAAAVAQGALLLMRAGADSRRIARLRAAIFPVQLVLTCGLAAWLGSVGAALGLAMVNFVAAPLWWRCADVTNAGKALVDSGSAGR